ncbi:putative transient receptor potential cation channel subfamily A member 1-like [Penaeus vannamei]|uniref:Putative transient receptor potential cation channel subfamily A member 1-like n=1 Tax=Penaeus vannamei TaxID=6689 RepID=A0A3R7LXL1_PENVA|nr:putative transient receptor potential cation channel subfamily A member 1-like [Penaeus vannamei]
MPVDQAELKPLLRDDQTVLQIEQDDGGSEGSGARSTRATDEVHQAAAVGNARALEQLLWAKKDEIKKQDRSGSTPLHLAAKGIHLRCCEMLLKMSTKEVNILDKLGNTPLMLALTTGNTSLEITKLLLSHKAKVDIANTAGQTPLHIAAEKGNVDICRILVEKDPTNINAVNKEKQTPLHFAAMNGNARVCSFLAEKGASVEARDVREYTPLHIAAKMGFTECCNQLIESGSSVDSTDKNGNTPLHLVLSARKNKDVDRHTALHIAIKNGNEEACKILFRSGADGNVTCDCHGTALHIAAEYGLHDICDLLSKYVKVNSMNQHLETPLHLAAKEGHVKCCQTLISRKASLVAEVKDSKNIPLHLAAKNGKAACCRVMMQSQPGLVNRKNAEEKSPLHYAVERRSLECCKELVVPVTDIWNSSPNIPSAVKMAYDKRCLDIFAFLLLSENVVGKYPRQIDIDIQAILYEQIELENNYMVSTILESKFGEECLLPRHTPGDSHYSQNDNFRLLVQKMPLLAQKALDDWQQDCLDGSTTVEKKKFILHHLDEVYIQYDSSDESSKSPKSLTPIKDAYQKVLRDDGRLKPDVYLEGKVDHAWQMDHVLSWMLRYGREDLVSHPVVTHWLNYKWNTYVRYGHYISIILALLLAVLLTVFNSVSMDWAMMKTLFSAPITREMVCVNFTVGPEVVPFLREQGHSAHVLGWVITIVTIPLIIFEIYKIIRLRLRYFKTLTIIYCTCMVMSFLFVGNYTSCSFLTHIREDVQWLAGLAAIILAWLHLIVLAWTHPRNPFVFNFERFFRALLAIVPPVAIVGVAFFAVYEIGSKGSLTYVDEWQVFVNSLVSLPMMATAVVVGLAAFIYLDAVSSGPRKRDRSLDERNIRMTLDFDILYPFLRKRFYAYWINRAPKERSRGSLRNLWRILECRNDDDSTDSSWSKQDTEVKMQEMSKTLKNIEQMLKEKILNSSSLEKEKE